MAPTGPWEDFRWCHMSYGHADSLEQVGRRHVETTVTWLEYSVTGCSPFIDEVANLEVGPILDDDQAQAQVAHRKFGLNHFVQASYRIVGLGAVSFF